MLYLFAFKMLLKLLLHDSLAGRYPVGKKCALQIRLIKLWEELGKTSQFQIAQNNGCLVYLSCFCYFDFHSCELYLWQGPVLCIIAGA